MNEKVITLILRTVGVLIMLGAFIIIPNSKPWYYKVILFDVGFILTMIAKVLFSFKSRKFGALLIAFMLSNGLFAQDYSRQVNAFAKSFEEKSTAAIQPYMSAALQFGEIPAENTPAIMTNIVTNLPKLKEMTVIKSEQGRAKVAYNFEGFGKSESYIYFDVEGNITRILLIEDLIRQEAEARRQQEGVQLPSPGELGNKYFPTRVEFDAPDGLTITGNLYEIEEKSPIILLLHQAGYNRIEYADIAPKLNELGYNCLVIDLRSGGVLAGKPNLTHTKAKEKGLDPKMIDAQQDIVAAIDYLNKKYKQKVIVWGSSFSSSLALLEANKNSKVKAVIAFSPGDYFEDARPSLSTVFSSIKKPFFVTSSKAESEDLSELIGAAKLMDNQYHFAPKSLGFHGARALWEGQEGAEEYWNAVIQFLTKIKR